MDDDNYWMSTWERKTGGDGGKGSSCYYRDFTMAAAAVLIPAAISVTPEGGVLVGELRWVSSTSGAQTAATTVDERRLKYGGYGFEGWLGFQTLTG